MHEREYALGVILKAYSLANCLAVNFMMAYLIKKLS